MPAAATTIRPPRSACAFLMGLFVWLVGVAAAFPLHAQVAGNFDAAFNPNVVGNAGGSVNAMAVQPDGKILIGGYFTSVGGQTRNGIARLNADGSLDITFDPGSGVETSGLVGSVSSLIVQADGKILIGGGFNTVNGQPRNQIARLNADGSVESTATFNTGTGPSGGPGGAGIALAVQSDGKILLGGYFTTVSGQARRGIARLNVNGGLEGTSTFNPGTGLSTDGGVFCCAVQLDGKIILGGEFSSVNGQSRNRIARLNSNGTLESTTTFNAGTGADSTVNALVVQPDGKILLGGTFVNVSGVARRGIARLNGDGTVETTATFNANFPTDSTANVTSLSVQSDGKILATGFLFSMYGVVRLLPDGQRESASAFNTGANANEMVWGVVQQAGGEILMGGSFPVTVNHTYKFITRLGNNAATQSLTVPSNARVQWLRGGTSPEVEQVTFEVSVDNGGSWIPLGLGVRISGGWELTGLCLPSNGRVRARGRTAGGIRNGSSGLTEVVTSFAVSQSAPPEIAVEQPAGTGIADGGSVTFAGVLTGGNASLTFAIKNTGCGDLTGLSISKDGADAAMFTVTTNPTPPLTGYGGSTAFTVKFAPLSTGIKTAAFHIASNDADESPFDINLTGTGLNNAPTISDISNQTVNEDTGTDALAISIGDMETSSASLTVVGSSSNLALVPDANINFGGSGANRTLRVTPAANQYGTATITVTVSDGLLTASDTFLLTVNAVDDVPTITGISDQTVNHDANTGALAFTVGDVETAAGLISVTGSSSNESLVPISNIIFGGSGANRTITATPVTPNAGGSAIITLTVNDGSSSASDTFVLTVNAPEIMVEQPAGTNLVDGTTRDFGTVNLGFGAPLSFTIRNTGTGPLSGLAISKDGSHAGDFSVGSLPVASLAPGESTSFSVTFNPAARGTRTAAIHIASDDADENPFDINLTGTGVNPEIAVEQPSGTGLVDGTATVNFGSFNVGTGGPLTFTIRNSGVDSLTALTVTKDGSEAGDFTIGALTGTPLAAGGSRTFTVTFNPAATGPRTAAIHIESNDADENPFDIVLTGTGTAPEIAVEQPAGQGLLDGDDTISLGTVNLGSNASLMFTVRNAGTGPLTGLAISKNGTNAADFTVSALGVTSLAAGAGRTFTVTFNPAAAGVRTAAIQIASNDADENPFDINLTGTGRAVPEIVVEQPAGTGRVDGSSVAVDFGKVPSGTSAGRTFTIRNTGTADLSGIAVTLNGGTAAGDFSIWDLGATTLAPGTATTFQVFFLPGGPGARTTTLNIASNDEDENPFDINLTGMRATPELDAWRQTYFGSTANSGAGADLSDPDRDGVVNLMEFATGSGPWTANAQPGELVKNGSSLEFTWPRRKAALAEISYAVEWSESLTGPWSAAGVSTVLFTDGSVMQVMKSTLPAGGSGKRFVRLRVSRL